MSVKDKLLHKFQTIPRYFEYWLHTQVERMSKINKHWNANKTHCSNGHLFDAKNTYHTTRDGRSMRLCRACDKARKRGRGGYRPKPDGFVRKTHCKHGHELTPENTVTRKKKGRDGFFYRECLTCRREAEKRRDRTI